MIGLETLMKTSEKYYLGLDIGTDSVGWAVTDAEYSISKRKGKSLWGVHLFEAGETAKQRRLYRTSRRRLQRRNQRVALLQSLFSEEIAKVDPGFFQRMKDSKYYVEDKTERQLNTLFNDGAYKDKEFHVDYPTIYHLRKALVESDEKFDLRLVYLAIHNIVKKRGHFLRNEVETNGEREPIGDIYNRLVEILGEFEILSEEALDKFRGVDLCVVEKSLPDEKLSRTAKKEKLLDAWNFDRKSPEGKKVAEIAKAATGLKFTFSALFDDENLKDAEFKDASFADGIEDKADDIAATLQDRYDVICVLKDVYDWSVLENIMHHCKYLSEAKVRDYEEHKEDLAFLRGVVKKFVPDRYNEFFRNPNVKGNYVSYSGKANTAGRKIPIDKKCGQADFCAFVRKELKGVKDLITKAYQKEGEKMFAELDEDRFMPKTVSKDNSVIPYQVHGEELDKILENASRHYEFLSGKGEDGLTVADKIKSLFSFRIPYFVGPLNSHSERSWFVRRESGKIYPWNFDKMVDLEGSAEKFINNLTSKCTYLFKEDVLPRDSLQYGRYMALNMLNKIKIDGDPISGELKQDLYREFFERRGGGVTKAKIAKHLTSSHPGFSELSEESITGIDDDPNVKVTSYRDLTKILGRDFNEPDAEEIIKSIVFLGDEKKMLKTRLKRLFLNLTDEQVKKLCSLRYREWGRLSSKFLTGITWKDPSTSVSKSILTLLWERNENLMELLPRFKEAIEKENSGFALTSLEDKINALYVSPPIKRSIRRSFSIVKEVKSIMNGHPAKIFIEVARGPQEKKRTVSRKKALDSIYAQCKADSADMKKEIDGLRESLGRIPEDRMRQDKLYLYYTQMGKSAYSGRTINIEDLMSESRSKVYDIDHIYPQSKIKDDSLVNRVLVYSSENQEKDNNYPLAPNVQQKMLPFWKRLRDIGLMPEEKFIRLTRTSALTEDDVNVFINRQLVETRQSTKAVGQLLGELFPDTKIVYVKARLVSDFRNGDNQFVPNDRDGTNFRKFLKCRELNDLHHAKDAYLNIVVGNVYDTQYSSRLFLHEVMDGKASVNRLFAFPIQGAWTPGAEGSIDVVDRMMSRNDILFTRYAVVRHKGVRAAGLFKQTIMKKGIGQLPVKTSDPRLADIKKYGGYTDVCGGYFCLVECSEKGKPVRKIIPVLIHNKNLFEESSEHYVKKEYGIEDGRILVPCIKYDALLFRNGFPMHISAKTGDRLGCKPAVQLVLPRDMEWYFREVLKVVARTKGLKDDDMPCDDSFMLVCPERNLELLNMLIDKMKSKPFNVQFNKMASKIEKASCAFKDLRVHEQCGVLNEIVRMLKCNSDLADLTLLGLGRNVGAVVVPQQIKDDVRLVSQSVTGFYEKTLDLRTCSVRRNEVGM